MSVKDIPVMRMRKDDSGNSLGDHFAQVSLSGVDAKGRTASTILADALSTPVNDVDQQELFEGGSDLYVGATLGQLFGAPVAVFGALTIIGAGLVAPPLAMAAFGAALFGHDELMSDRQIRIFILNGFDHPIEVSDAFISHGEEAAACAHGTLASDGKTFQAAGHRQIPAAGDMTLGGNKIRLWGAGLFGYQKHTTMGVSFYGTSGALSFSCASPAFGSRTPALAFNNGWGDNDIGLAATNDLALFNSTRDKFFNDSIDAGKGTVSAIASPPANEKGPQICACFSPSKPTKTSSVDIVVTIYPWG